MVDDRRLVKKVAEAVRSALAVTTPPRTPSTHPGWPYALPITWEAQVTYLWQSCYDALDLARYGLSRRLSPGDFGPLRYLEAIAWIRWLVEAPDERPRRAFAFAIGEIDDWHSLLRLRPSNPLQRDRADAEHGPWLDQEALHMSEMRKRAHSLAEGQQLLLERRPPVGKLLGELLEDKLPYSMLSDVGSHPGMALILMMTGARHRTSSGVEAKAPLLRAAYMSLGCALYLDTVQNAASALGDDALAQRIVQFHDRSRDLLKAGMRDTRLYDP